jgi:hypothetical protein
LHPCAFDCADVDENILAAIIRLDESEPLLAIEPLHGSLCHIALLSVTCALKAARQRSRFIRDLEESRQSGRGVRTEAKSFGRSSIEAMWGDVLRPARLLGKKSWLFGLVAQPQPI